jgi:uncharacterized protein with von Willebrand factor type A (vWA) domain
MRVTKPKIKKKTNGKITELVNKTVVVNDFTIAKDFAKDVYVLFRDKKNNERLFKNFWQLFIDIKKQYVKYKVGNLMTSFDFYNNIKKFLKYFTISRLFHELEKLDPMEALEIFLQMFQPEDKQESSQKGKQDKDNNGKNKKQSKDKKGLSADKSSIPINMGKFKEDIAKINDIIESGIFNKEDMQDYLNKNAGIGHNELKIENIKEIIRKISENLRERDLDIFKIARKKELTEVWHREEELKSSLTPDNEMTIRKIETPLEVLKALPTQYIFNNEEFSRKIAQKELLVRDYQHRRLKKQALYLLIDVSGSMAGEADKYACGVALSLVRQAINEGATYFLRFFDGSPMELHTIKTKEEAKEMCNTLLKNPFSGGGTDIERAIRQAVTDIKQNPTKFEKVEIMVISDGRDSVNIDKNYLDKIKLHSTIINNNNEGLKKISDTYIELDSDDF